MLMAGLHKAPGGPKWHKGAGNRTRTERTDRGIETRDPEGRFAAVRPGGTRSLQAATNKWSNHG